MTIFEYNKAIKLLRDFFQEEKGFIEIPAQSRKSILAACEDPETVSQYIFEGQNWPLPQTGQMWLEKELLKNPEVMGVFCQTTSYRNEPFPIPGRHDKIFPMFEFESHGDMSDLIELESDLCKHLGLDKPSSVSYNKACEDLGKPSGNLESKDEEALQKIYGNSISLQMFPQRTHPFWNMKRSSKPRVIAKDRFGKDLISSKDPLYNKVDVLLYGMETIGSAERSCNPTEMREDFLSISDGQYAKLLFNLFGENRVMTELDEYLRIPMLPRFGAGIGVTRLVRALKLNELL